MYYLSELPEGYEFYEIDSSDLSVYTAYVYTDTNSYLTFKQSVKDGYKRNFNTENREFEELDIDGRFALYLDDSNSESLYGSIVWDNVDYIFQVTGDFAKGELIDLAKSAKL